MGRLIIYYWGRCRNVWLNLFSHLITPARTDEIERKNRAWDSRQASEIENEIESCFWKFYALNSCSKHVLASKHGMTPQMQFLHPWTVDMPVDGFWYHLFVTRLVLFCLIAWLYFYTYSRVPSPSAIHKHKQSFVLLGSWNISQGWGHNWNPVLT